jgi:hypothetical protein
MPAGSNRKQAAPQILSAPLLGQFHAYDLVANNASAPFVGRSQSRPTAFGSRDTIGSRSLGTPSASVAPVVAAEDASAGADEVPPAVIGEGMTSRVVPYAEANGYETYAGLENPENYTSEELLAHNRAQIEAWKAEGRQIFDVGPEPGRAFYPMETSPNYGMEHNLVRGYAGYQPVVLPGEANWWEALFVP